MRFKRKIIKSCNKSENKSCNKLRVVIKGIYNKSLLQQIEKSNILIVTYKTRHTCKFMQIPCVFYDGIYPLQSKCSL